MELLEQAIGITQHYKPEVQDVAELDAKIQEWKSKTKEAEDQLQRELASGFVVPN